MRSTIFRIRSGVATVIAARIVSEPTARQCRNGIQRRLSAWAA